MEDQLILDSVWAKGTSSVQRAKVKGLEAHWVKDWAALVSLEARAEENRLAELPEAELSEHECEET